MTLLIKIMLAYKEPAYFFTCLFSGCVVIDQLSISKCLFRHCIWYILYTVNKIRKTWTFWLKQPVWLDFSFFNKTTTPSSLWCWAKISLDDETPRGYIGRMTTDLTGSILLSPSNVRNESHLKTKSFKLTRHDVFCAFVSSWRFEVIVLFFIL